MAEVLSRVTCTSAIWCGAYCSIEQAAEYHETEPIILDIEREVVIGKGRVIDVALLVDPNAYFDIEPGMCIRFGVAVNARVRRKIVDIEARGGTWSLAWTDEQVTVRT